MAHIEHLNILIPGGVAPYVVLVDGRFDSVGFLV